MYIYKKKNPHQSNSSPSESFKSKIKNPAFHLRPPSLGAASAVRSSLAEGEGPLTLGFPGPTQLEEPPPASSAQLMRKDLDEFVLMRKISTSLSPCATISSSFCPSTWTSSSSDPHPLPRA